MNPRQRSFCRVTLVLVGALTIDGLTACATSSGVVGNPAVSNANAATTAEAPSAEAPSAEAPSPEQSFQIPVTVLNADSNEVPTDARPSDLTFLVGVISGHINGNPGPHVLGLPIGHAPSLRLDLASLKPLSVDAATIGRSMSSSVTISPGETRFARLSTVAWSKKKPSSTFVRFADSETREGLLLVYFDRPCRLTGRAATQDVADYDFAVDSAGWTWLAIRQVGPKHYSITRATNPHPTLVITLRR
jgi:hypothetical protein